MIIVKEIENVEHFMELYENNSIIFYDNQSIRFMEWCFENEGWINGYTSKTKLEIFKKQSVNYKQCKDKT